MSYINMESCRVCLSTKMPMLPLFKYKLSGNYAEMLTSVADVKISANDGLPEKICYKCCTTLEKAFLLKTVAERSDRKLRMILAGEKSKSTKAEDGTNIVIEKIESTENIKVKTEVLDDERDGTRETTKSSPKHEDFEAEYLDDNIFQGNDDDTDEDYIPPSEKKKTKFEKPMLSANKCYNTNNVVVRRIKITKTLKDDLALKKIISKQVHGQSGRSKSIVCYPVLKNGLKGAPIVVRRMKDFTKFKMQSSNYRTKETSLHTTRTKSSNESKPVKSIATKEKLVCPICGILTYSLNNHLATHEEKKKYACSECPKSFSNKTNWTEHLKCHTGIRDHICETCGAGFYNRKTLNRHNMIHIGVKPFNCNICNKNFYVKCDLTRHLRVHAGYKPYKCNVCAMSFNAKQHLITHERMHTGERPYVCQVCDVTFGYKVNLNKHMMKIHGVNIKFKSIHVVTEEILKREKALTNETHTAVANILPRLTEVPPAGAHETVGDTTD